MNALCMKSQYPRSTACWHLEHRNVRKNGGCQLSLKLLRQFRAAGRACLSVILERRMGVARNFRRAVPSEALLMRYMLCAGNIVTL